MGDSKCIGIEVTSDMIKLRGRILMKLFDRDGKLKWSHSAKNTLTVLYDATVADRMAAGADALISHMAVGSTTGGKTTASTALEAQIGTRYALDGGTPAQQAGADDNDVQYHRTFAAGEGTGSIKEVGMFTHITNATMMAYHDGFGQIDKAAADSLAVTWTVTHGAS